MNFSMVMGIQASKIYLIVGLLLTMTVAHVAVAGTGVTGGGNVEEIDFVLTGREIGRQLQANPARATEVLRIRGIDEKFLNALDSTSVQCAFGVYAKEIRKFNKLAFFDAKSNSIYLDCSRYAELRAGTFKDALVFHEYMRALGLEGSDYRVSSNLPALIAKNERPETPRQEPQPTCPPHAVFASGFGMCLSSVNCPRGLVADPAQPTQCANPETGRAVMLKICGQGRLLTDVGCLDQAMCPAGYGFDPSGGCRPSFGISVGGCLREPGTVWNGTKCVRSGDAGFSPQCVSLPGTIWNGTSCVPYSGISASYLGTQYPKYY